MYINITYHKLPWLLHVKIFLADSLSDQVAQTQHLELSSKNSATCNRARKNDSSDSFPIPGNTPQDIAGALYCWFNQVPLHKQAFYQEMSLASSWMPFRDDRDMTAFQIIIGRIQTPYGSPGIPPSDDGIIQLQ